MSSPTLWKGRLDALYVTIAREARSSRVTTQELVDDRGWFWRILPHGAVVGIRRRPDLDKGPTDRLELRLARPGELLPENEDRWETEVRTFLKHFQIRATDGTYPAEVPGIDWLRIEPQARDAGKTVARFLSLLPGEIRPGKARCYDCANLDVPVHTEIEWSPSFGVRGQACHQHALERGRRAQSAHTPQGKDNADTRREAGPNP